MAVIKPEHLDLVRNVSYSFDKTLRLTVETFDDAELHFYDIAVHPDGLGIYCQPANTCQYRLYTSFSKWNYKTAWTVNILHKAIVICSKETLRMKVDSI